MNIIRVLIADDHPIFRHGLTQLLNQQTGIQVIAQAANGVEAVTLTKELKPEVVIMDMVLPDMNGIEAIKEIKAFLPGTAILILSAYDYEAYTVASLQAGASGYILKDSLIDEVVESVRLVRDGGLVFKEDKLRELLGKTQYPSDGKAQRRSSLPDREIEIVRLVAKGLSNHDISMQLKISERTVENHLGRIFRKLKVKSRTEMVSHSMKEGLVTVDDLS